MAGSQKKTVVKEQVNVRIADPLLQRLDKIGEPMGWTRTELIRRAVEEYVQRHEQPAKPARQ